MPSDRSSLSRQNSSTYGRRGGGGGEGGFDGWVYRQREREGSDSAYVSDTDMSVGCLYVNVSFCSYIQDKQLLCCLYVPKNT
jgi:hypothetical protein